MRIIQVSEFGGPEVLVPVEVPDPVPGPGEVVVDVAAADVLHVDTQVRSGLFDFGVRPPYVPGDGFAGVVSALGPGVPPSWLGRSVAAYTGGFLGTGGYRERGVVAVDDLVPVAIPLTTAAALLHDAVTGLALIDAAGIRPGEWVLVTAAAGGMGTLLLQLAEEAGAHVVGAARKAATVDYSAPGWAAEAHALTGGEGFAVVFDGVGGAIGRAAFGITADGGRFSAHGAAGGEGFAAVAPERGIRVRGIADVQLPAARRRELLMRAMAADLRPHIGATFPLERAADAHRALEARAVRGTALLVTG